MSESLHVAVKMYIKYSFFTFIFAVLLPQKFAINLCSMHSQVLLDRDLDLSRSRDVIGHVIIFSTVCGFI